MLIFIAELGFAHHPEDLLMEKTGIILASLVARIADYVWLSLSCPPTFKNLICNLNIFGELISPA
jgi:hypothetical protein